jgi:hypothetical protein
MVDRQLLFWAITTRRQLERWEVCVAEIISLDLQSHKPPGQLTWRSQAEHHFVFLAARNLVRAAELAAESSIETPLADTLKDVRDLLEHWTKTCRSSTRDREVSHHGSQGNDSRNETQPRLHIGPPRGTRRKAPCSFPSGPPAAELHNALDRVETSVTRRRPELIKFIPERTDQPWLGDDWGKDRWFPKPAKASSTPD